jgi:hypothetical protein
MEGAADLHVKAHGRTGRSYGSSRGIRR